MALLFFNGKSENSVPAMRFGTCHFAATRLRKLGSQLALLPQRARNLKFLLAAANRGPASGAIVVTVTPVTVTVTVTAT